MAAKDITGEAVDEAKTIMQGVLAEIHKLMPLGPDKVEVSRSELKRKLLAMTPQGRDNFAATVGGVDKVLELLNG